MKKKTNFQAKKTQILHCLQSSLTNASILGLNTMVSNLLPLYQVLICGTYALPQLQCFWSMFQTEHVGKGFYKAGIGNMRLRLQELQEADSEPQELKQKKPTAIKKSMRFFTIGAYCLYPKQFKQNWLAVIIIILWPTILALNRLVNCCPENITNQFSTTTSKPM